MIRAVVFRLLFRDRDSIIPSFLQETQNPTRLPTFLILLVAMMMLRARCVIMVFLVFVLMCPPSARSSSRCRLGFVTVVMIRAVVFRLLFRDRGGIVPSFLQETQNPARLPAFLILLVAMMMLRARCVIMVFLLLV